MWRRDDTSSSSAKIKRRPPNGAKYCCPSLEKLCFSQRFAETIDDVATWLVVGAGSRLIKDTR